MSTAERASFPDGEICTSSSFRRSYCHHAYFHTFFITPPTLTPRHTRLTSLILTH
jgi:hypothetical protein